MAYSNPAWAEQHCRFHRYEGDPQSLRDNGCLEINWVTGDVVNGPFHTNDRFLVCGRPEWFGEATSSAPDPLYNVNTSCGTPNPSFPTGSPAFDSGLSLPPSNASIKAEADHTLSTAEGCMFTGPTQVIIDGDQLRIKSPYTKVTGAHCGSDYDDWTNFGNVPERIIDIPPNGVVYVQNIPASGDNAHSGSCGSGNNGLGYPRNGDVGGSYSCRDGDAFVEGELDGRLTVAAENDVVITWHTEYADDSPASDDMLGLVANNFVEVYHPTNAWNNNLWALPNHSARFVNPRIDAAILALDHSFLVQQWNRGNTNGELGTLHVTGVIAQKFRGPVGQTNGRGYLKNYVYDERLRYQSPPHFIDPVASSWGVVSWSEQ